MTAAQASAASRRRALALHPGEVAACAALTGQSARPGPRRLRRRVGGVVDRLGSIAIAPAVAARDPRGGGRRARPHPLCLLHATAN